MEAVSPLVEEPLLTMPAIEPAKVAQEEGLAGSGQTARDGDPYTSPCLVVSRGSADPEGLAAAHAEATVVDVAPARAQAEKVPSSPPFIHTARRTARFRMPRPEKQQLLDNFCGLGKSDPRTLIVVGHADDESIGAGARLAQLGEVWVAHATDGAPRDPAVARRHAFETRHAYAEKRHREALEALALAGVTEDRVTCLGAYDGEASMHLVDLCLQVAEMVDTLEPDVVVTHPYEGGHTDHDATAFAVHLACGLLRREGVKPPAVFEITSYNAPNGRKVVQEFLPHRRADLDRKLIRLGQEERELKKRMYDCFETQQAVLREFDTAVEKFRPAPRYVFTRPPHPGQLNYERYGDRFLGRRFRESAEEALRSLRLRRGT